MSLLKELSGVNPSQKVDSSTNMASDQLKTDVKFSQMRNVMNMDGNLTGTGVNDYLNRAQELNDEVESVGFAVETDDGDIIKIYVNAQDADTFEQEMSKLLGLEGDIEEAINELAQKYDIIDVVWPDDGGSEGDLSIDDDFDDEPMLPGDADIISTGSEEGELNTSDAVETQSSDVGDGGVDDDFEDIPSATDVPTDSGTEVNDAEGADVDEFEDIPRADDNPSEPSDSPDDEPSDDEPSDDDEMEPVLNDDGSQKLDKNGEPVMRRKKPVEAPIGEGVREDISAHVRRAQTRGNRGKYQINATVSGGITGRRTAPLKRNGEILFFDTKVDAQNEAVRLTKHKNRAGATASYSYTPALVENAHKDNTMTIGTSFLSRLAEASDPEAAKISIPLDTQHRQLVMNLKKPIEKKIISLFAMAGIIGRLLRAEPDIEDRVREAGDMLRKNVAAKNAFTAFHNGLANAKGYGITVEKKNPSEQKRGNGVQQKFEAVMVALGLPEGLITTDGPSPIGSFVNKTTKLIIEDGELRNLLDRLAVKLGVRGALAPEDRVIESVVGRQFKARLNELDGVQSNDPYLKDVLGLLRVLGVPEENLSFKRTALLGSLKAARDNLTSRQIVDNKIEALTKLITQQQKPARGMRAGPAMESLTEAFGDLEALTQHDLEHLNMLEPSGGPAMMATYESGSSHNETLLAIGVDPEADGRETLRVGIDGPWDGSMHARYFEDTADGYKKALAYANILKTANLKTGGRPKGWK